MKKEFVKDLKRIRKKSIKLKENLEAYDNKTPNINSYISEIEKAIVMLTKDIQKSSKEK